MLICLTSCTKLHQVVPCCAMLYWDSEAFQLWWWQSYLVDSMPASQRFPSTGSYSYHLLPMRLQGFWSTQGWSESPYDSWFKLFCRLSLKVKHTFERSINSLLMQASVLCQDQNGLSVTDMAILEAFAETMVASGLQKILKRAAIPFTRNKCSRISCGIWWSDDFKQPESLLSFCRAVHKWFRCFWREKSKRMRKWRTRHFLLPIDLTK